MNARKFFATLMIVAGLLTVSVAFAANDEPYDAEAYFNRGFAYALSGNFNQAIADVTKAIELEPNVASRYQLRGLCYQQLGDEAKAQADFDKAKSLGYSG